EGRAGPERGAAPGRGGGADVGTDTGRAGPRCAHAGWRGVELDSPGELHRRTSRRVAARRRVPDRRRVRALVGTPRPRRPPPLPLAPDPPARVRAAPPRRTDLPGGDHRTA